MMLRHSYSIFFVYVLLLLSCPFYARVEPYTRVEPIDHDMYVSPFQLLHPDYNLDTITVYKFLENQKHSYVLFIKDKQNNRFVVKQERSISLKAQFQSVLEMLCSYMAVEMGISSQQVRLLPIGMSFPGKFLIGRPATLHTLMPGMTIREMEEGPYKHLFIKQNNNPTKPWERRGFNRNVIKWMALHPDLAPIVALDTFVENKDRNQANLLYDVKENRFYAIDMALIYDDKQGGLSVPELACEHVVSMIKSPQTFTSKEYAAIKKYKNFLEKLVNHFPPTRVSCLLNKFTDQSGLKDKYCADPNFSTMCHDYNQRINDAYVNVKNLINLLSKLLEVSSAVNAANNIT